MKSLQQMAQHPYFCASYLKNRFFLSFVFSSLHCKPPLHLSERVNIWHNCFHNKQADVLEGSLSPLKTGGERDHQVVMQLWRFCSILMQREQRSGETRFLERLQGTSCHQSWRTAEVWSSVRKRHLILSPKPPVIPGWFDANEVFEQIPIFRRELLFLWPWLDAALGNFKNKSPLFPHHRSDWGHGRYN